jgi:hypothetical protein
MGFFGRSKEAKERDAQLLAAAQGGDVAAARAALDRLTSRPKAKCAALVRALLARASCVLRAQRRRGSDGREH